MLYNAIFLSLLLMNSCFFQQVGGFTVIFHGNDEQYTWLIRMKSGMIAHGIRDAMYRAMAPSRQINPFQRHVSSDTYLNQVNKAPANRTFDGPKRISRKASRACYTSGKGLKDKIVVTPDSLLFHKHKRGGMKQEWVAVFNKDVRAIEINSPGQWPTWYAVMWYFPPWGLFGCHRQILGAPRCGIGMWLYRLTLGGFGILWVADAFIMCCCIDMLRMRNEIKVSVTDGDDLDLSILIDKTTDGERFRNVLNAELRRNPGKNFMLWSSSVNFSSHFSFLISHFSFLISHFLFFVFVYKYFVFLCLFFWTIRYESKSSSPPIQSSSNELSIRVLQKARRVY